MTTPNTPTFDEALDTVIARALRWCRVMEQSRGALEEYGEDVDAAIAEVDQAIEVIRDVQRRSDSWMHTQPVPDRGDDIDPEEHS